MSTMGTAVLQAQSQLESPSESLSVRLSGINSASNGIDGGIFFSR